MTADGTGGSTGSEGVPPDVDAALRAGVALFNEGHWLAAHEPWEAAWLPLDGGADERLLHGLIQFAAATHHARSGNYAGAVGCGVGAAGYLDDLGPTRRGLALAPIRRWCRRLAADPERIERARPPTLRIDGVAVGFDDLDFEATLALAPALAATVGVDAARDPDGDGLFEAAARLAREERGTGRTRFAELLFAFVRTPDARPQIAARLADHVERERRKRRDVDDLF
ncbi:DUF309 domain-containing protein [Halorubrum sp. JWXQ-INN 858]|uniref:DUF309 domain-containing protein n=1 Tax=Halorubrum sp. JWXQ-INN 858 TaxID=2690782 RepID=UPI0013FC1028|nr:DUF309 domain-containing protein [Halorubrum sp. JWXQ-INN 858]MWV66020.1 DUF309 domain-containing protein [Halorubrum sp. JWXQ-INN 858]